MEQKDLRRKKAQKRVAQQLGDVLKPPDTETQKQMDSIRTNGEIVNNFNSVYYNGVWRSRLDSGHRPVMLIRSQMHACWLVNWSYR